ncbi:MAG: carboxymuconolactone decarboxylase family protein [Ilumatobacteraceae bacterium]
MEGLEDVEVTRRGMPVPRILPLDRDDWDPPAIEALGRLVERERVDNLFTTLARHPALLKRWLVFGYHMLFGSTLDERLRELVILRMAHHKKCEYEFAQHVLVARNVGVLSAKIDAVVARTDDVFTPLELAALSAVDDLVQDDVVSDETWERLCAELNEQQTMDLVFTIGGYNLVAWVLNSFGVQLDPHLQQPHWAANP